MRKIILILVALATVASAGSIWGLIKNSGLPTVKSKAFQIEVKGANLRGYIFQPPGLDMVCINVWGDDSQTLECKTFKELGLKKEK